MCLSVGLDVLRCTDDVITRDKSVLVCLFDIYKSAMLLGRCCCCGVCCFAFTDRCLLFVVDVCGWKACTRSVVAVLWRNAAPRGDPAATHAAGCQHQCLPQQVLSHKARYFPCHGEKCQGRVFFGLFCLFWVPPLGLSASSLLPLPTHTHVAATHIYMHSVSTHALTHTYARTYADTHTHARTHAHSRTHACTHARTHARTMLPKHRTSPHDHRSVVKRFTRRDSSQVKTRSVARIPDGPKCLTQSTAASFWIHTRIEKTVFLIPTIPLSS